MLQEFVQAVEDAARSIVNEIHTAIPGKVVSFDAKTCTATIQPVGKFVCPNGKKVNYPKVTEVPFCFPYSETAGVGMAFPVKAGDSCLIVVSEIELDEWRTNAVADVEQSLKFDLTSAIAMPGLLKATPVLLRKAIDNNAVVVGSGGTSLMVSGSGVTINGSLTVTGSISSGGQVSGGSLSVNGAVSCGSVAASGDVTGGGKSLASHTHIASADGGETGGPN